MKSDRSGKETVRGRIHVDRAGLIPRRHRLVAAGRVLGELLFSWGAAAFFVLPSARRLRVERAAPFGGAYCMCEAGRERASASWQPLEPQARILFDDHPFRLSPASRARERWGLWDGQGDCVLELTLGRWGRTQIDVEAGVELELVAFAYALIVIRQRADRWRQRGAQRIGAC